MKKLTAFAAIMTIVLVLASCKKDEYQAFVGTWGVERIDYYNIDYAGNPIEDTRETYKFTPGDKVNGIDLVFRADKTGEMRDSSRDTLYFDLDHDPDHVYETVIICPDTTVVTKFTYSYNSKENLLHMKLEGSKIYEMKIEFNGDDKLIYENEYYTDYIEKAWLVRYSSETRAAKSSKPSIIKRHQGSLLSDN